MTLATALEALLRALVALVLHLHPAPATLPPPAAAEVLIPGRAPAMHPAPRPAPAPAGGAVGTPLVQSATGAGQNPPAGPAEPSCPAGTEWDPTIPTCVARQLPGETIGRAQW